MVMEETKLYDVRFKLMPVEVEEIKLTAAVQKLEWIEHSHISIFYVRSSFQPTSSVHIHVHVHTGMLLCDNLD